MKRHPMIIALDFDGTISRWENDLIPRKLLPNAKEVVNWAADFCYIIIWTCRQGKVLEDAKKFLKQQGIRYNAVNENAPFTDFVTSRKIHSDILIDDLGISNYVQYYLNIL
jgi:hypothetical protein